jgi:hypothetical protein
MATLRAKDFTVGIPFDLTLTSLDVKEAPDNGYGPAWIFRSNLGSIYLPEAPARAIIAQIETQGIQPNEPIRFTQVKTIGNGSRWIVDRAPSLQRQLEDSLANVRSIQSAPMPQPAQAPPPAQATQPIAAPVATPAASSKLMACFMSALDAVNEAQTYARNKGIGITFSSDNVTSAALSCYINECRNGGAR